MKNLLTIILISLTTIANCQNEKKLLKAFKPIKKTFYEEIDVEYKEGFLFAKVTINNNIYDFLIDTGSPTVIDASIAKELNLTSIFSKDFTDASGITQSEEFVVVNNLRFGELEYENVLTTVDDMSLYGELASCNNLKGIIGAEFFKDSRAVFSIEKIIITNDKKLMPPIKGGNKLNLTNRFNPILTTKHNFGVEEEMLFDTGLCDYVHWSSHSLSIIEPTLPDNYLNLVNGVGQSFATAYNQDIVQEDKRKCIMPSFTIGNLPFINIPLYIEKKDKGSSIGCRILEHCDIVIDWKKKKYKVIEKKNNGFPNNGFFMSSDGLVFEIWENSPWKELELDMKIVKINNQRIDDFSSCELRKESFEIFSTKIKSIELENGRILTLD